MENFQVVAVCSSDKNNNKVYYEIRYTYVTRNNCSINLCLNNKPLKFNKRQDAIRVASILNKASLRD